jgi:hypothetical protein
MKKLNNPTQEELFDLWCDDMLEAGFLTKVLTTSDLVNPMVLFDGLFHDVPTEHVGRNGVITTKVKKVTILSKITYKPDRILFWAPEAQGVFYKSLDTVGNAYFFSQINNTTGEVFSCVEVKAPPGYGGANTSDASFRVKQKWVYEKLGIFVNKVYNKPSSKGTKLSIYLWPATFTPSRYFYMDKKAELRKFSTYTPRTLEEFLEP